MTPLDIFISYAHDRFRYIAQRLYEDLVDAGHVPFKDNSAERGIPYGHHWPRELQDALEQCDIVISLISAHAMREEGVCLDEITYARNLQKGILSVRLEGCKLPLLLTRVHCIDLNVTERDGVPFVDETEYKTVLETVRKIACGELRLTLSHSGDVMEDKLLETPFQYEQWIDFKVKGFTGRKWLTRDVLEALETQKLLCITGIAGSGKSSFLAHLAQAHPASTAGFFMVRYDHITSRSACYALRALAYQLTKQFDVYKSKMANHALIDQLKSIENPTELFETLFGAPLHAVSAPEKPLALMIDALDELPRIEGERLIDALRSIQHVAPDWLRFIVTMRPESALLTRLRGATTVFAIDGETGGNREDCAQFLRTGLDALQIDYTDATLERAIRNSQCNFLYLNFWLEELKNHGVSTLNPDNVPASLAGLYLGYLDRVFSNDDEFFEAKAHPLLSLVCAARRPLSRSDAQTLLGVTKAVLVRILDRLGTLLLPSSDGTISLYHRSLREFLITEDAGTYIVDAEQGEQDILKYIRAHVTDFTDLDPAGYIFTQGFEHLLNAKDGQTIARLVKDCDLRLLERLAMALAGREAENAGELFSWLSGQIEGETWLEVGKMICDVLRRQGELPKIKNIMSNASKWIATHSQYHALCKRYFDAFADIYSDHIYQLSNTALEQICESLNKIFLDVNDLNTDEARYLSALCMTQIGDLYKRGDRIDNMKHAYTKSYNLLQTCLSQSVLCTRKRTLVAVYTALGDDKRNNAITRNDFLQARDFYQKALAIDEELSRDFPSLDTKRGLSVSYDRMGGIAEAEDDLACARDFYQKALAIWEELARDFPSLDTKRGLSISYERMGDIAKAEDDLAQARDFYQKMRVIDEELTRDFPSLATKRGMSICYGKMGDIAKAEDNLARARDFYQKALVIWEELAKDFPSLATKRGLSVSYDRMGDMAKAEDDLARARGFYKNALVIREELAKDFPSLDTKRGLSVSYDKMGNIAKAEDDLAQARDFYKNALAIDEELARDFPSLDTKRGLSVSYDRMGGIAEAEDDLAQARDFYQKMLVIDEELARDFPSLDTKRGLSVSYERMGNITDIAMDEDDIACARDFYQKSLAIWEELVRDFPSLDTKRELAVSYYNMGELFKAHGSHTLAKEYYTKALSIAEVLVRQFPSKDTRNIVRVLKMRISEL